MARAAGRGCATQIITLVLAPVIVAACVAIAGLVAVAATPSPQVRLVVAFGVFIALLMAFAAGALLFASRRARVLDAGFAQLGVAPGASLVNVREYHGSHRGRAVDALYSRRGPLLETSVEARVNGALAVGTRTAAGEVIRGIAGAREVPLADPAFAAYIVSSADPVWASAMLATPAVRAAVLGLLADPTGRELRMLALRPGAVRLTRRYFDPDRAVAEVAPMIDAIAALGATVETLPGPAVPVALSEFEREARKRPMAMGMRIVAVIVGVVLLVTVLATAAVLSLTPARTIEPAVTPSPVDQPTYGGRRRRR